MKRTSLILMILVVFYGTAVSQKVFTKNGRISFFSKTSMENIKADNNQVMSVLNTKTGELQFSLLIKGFHFQKALMEEHFNESYMESDKYPKASFKGTVSNMADYDLSKDGVYNVSVTGDLTMHGITKNTTAAGTLTVKGGKVVASSSFKVTVADYKISIPSLFRDNIADTVDVTVSSSYDQKM